MVNLSHFIRFHAIRSPDSVAIVYQSDRITYAQLWQRVQDVATFLSEQGVGAGDVVAVFMKNSAAFMEIAFASSYLGAVILPINYRLAAEEVEYIVRDANARIIFADDEFGEIVDSLDTVHLVDEAGQGDMRTLIGTGRPIPEEVPRAPEDLFRLMYTSGTTDRPKGVMHSYQNFYWKNMDHVISLGLSRRSRLLVTGPLYHVGAFDLPGVAVLWLGGMMAIHRDFEVPDTLASIQEEKLNCTWLAPVMLGQILAHPDRNDFDVSSLEWCIGGGEKTPESRIRGFSEYFRNGRYIDGYGLTESVSGDTLMEPGMEITKIGSTGRALAHVRIQIMDDDGAILAPGTEGEICLHGPKVTKSYWNNPEKTAASFHGDWFRTGDIGYLDQDGFLFLTDRKKDMIISGGENISSSEVERILYMLPQIKEAAIIGLPDERWGETPVAIVVVNDGDTLEFEELTQHCRAHLAAFKAPKRLILCDALPRNPSGKILKRILRDDYS
ncbi:MAG: acyl-CoA synthetase [Gammaproteobacteria bacterium]|nr:MAG: acyl-CoA synthetase [Gammaproteobacteria bacterium]RLA61694.1 MAG: acyl-CoA synthetase [Gammaproteobacteria bacterium]